MRHMTPALFIAVAAACALPTAVFAQDCSGDTTYSGTNLNDKLVCAYRGDGMTNPSNRWSEIHNNASGGSAILGEWGRGSDDPAGSYDPNVGNWSYSEEQISYDYGSYEYTWALCGDGSNPVVFCETGCDSGTVAATIQSINSIPVSTTDSNPCGW